MSNINTISRVDKYCKSIQLSDGTIFNCAIYDTAGLERYEALNLTYYRQADAVLLVYDITKKSTFDRVKSFYIKNIKDKCPKGVSILLLGNKTDKENERQVTYEEGIALASEENYEFKESSCLQNKNVTGAFESLIERRNVDKHKMSRRSTSRNNSIVDFTNSRPLLDLDYEMKRFNTDSKSEMIKKKSKTDKSYKLDKNKSAKSSKKKRCC